MEFKQIYASPLQEIYFNEEQSIIKNTWLSTNIDFSDMQEEMQHWMENFEKTKARFMLTDSSLGIIVIPKVQDWIIQFLFPTVIEKGVKKYAIMLSDDLFSMISVEQMFDEAKQYTSDEFQQLFFKKEDEEKAWDWLK